MGTGGEMMCAFALLIKSMWSREFREIEASKLTDTLAQFYPQFTNNEQHDSQVILYTFLVCLPPFIY